MHVRTPTIAPSSSSATKLKILYLYLGRQSTLSVTNGPRAMLRFPTSMADGCPCAATQVDDVPRALHPTSPSPLDASPRALSCAIQPDLPK